jgi:hypothetical protein
MALNYPVQATITTLTDAATIAVNAAAGTTQRVTIAASRNMGAPSNPTDGQVIEFEIKQGGAGSFTITWDAIYQWTTQIPQPTLSTAVGAVDSVAFKYNSTSNKWWARGYALGAT